MLTYVWGFFPPECGVFIKAEVIFGSSVEWRFYVANLVEAKPSPSIARVSLPLNWDFTWLTTQGLDKPTDL